MAGSTGTKPGGVTIGQMNGPWAIMLKITLVAVIPWSAFMTVNQILDNQFRGEGERFTAEDARLQTQLLLNEVRLELSGIELRLDQMIPASELLSRDNMLEHRVEALEANYAHMAENLTHLTSEVLKRMNQMLDGRN